MNALSCERGALGKRNFPSADLLAIKQQSIVAFALSLGYERDEKRSTAKSICLHRGADRVLVKLGGDAESYCTVGGGSGRDYGDIISFVQNRLGLSFVEAVKTLEGKSFFLPNALTHEPSTAISTIDYRKKAAAVWEHARWVPEHPYLLQRGISSAVLNDPRFADTFRLGSKGVAIFPHLDRGRPRLCGYEIRGDGVKAFGAGVKKGLWLSRNASVASSIVICESAIDCLSHATLHGGSSAYAAFGGGLGAKQVDLLRGLIGKAIARGASVIIGTDNDETGNDYAATLVATCNYVIERLIPIGKDFNDDLVAVVGEVSQCN